MVTQETSKESELMKGHLKQQNKSYSTRESLLASLVRTWWVLSQTGTITVLQESLVTVTEDQEHVSVMLDISESTARSAQIHILRSEHIVSLKSSAQMTAVAVVNVTLLLVCVHVCRIAQAPCVRLSCAQNTALCATLVPKTSALNVLLATTSPEIRARHVVRAMTLTLAVRGARSKRAARSVLILHSLQ